MSTAPAPVGIGGEVRKLPAFFRRDLLVLWSYRVSLLTDWASLVIQAFVFSMVGRLVDESALPIVAGRRVDYVEFVSVGIAMASVLQVGLVRLMSVIRQEQLMGTLESLLLTPTRPMTLLVGSVAYDVIYVPLRTVAFFGFMALLFGADFRVAGWIPATAVFAAFLPVMWGLGLTGAAAVLTFKRGAGVTGAIGTLIALASGAYFPLSVLPGWVQAIARVNPMTIATEAVRETTLATEGWTAVADSLPYLALWAVGSMFLGTAAFRTALRREQAKGTLGLY